MVLELCLKQECVKPSAGVATTSQIDNYTDDASEFHADGYIVLRDVLPAKLVERLHMLVLETFNECQAHIDARPRPLSIGKSGGFAEIVQRQTNRYEMRYGMGMREHPRIGAHHKEDATTLQELRKIVMSQPVQRVVARCLAAKDANSSFAQSAGFIPVTVTPFSSCLYVLIY